MLGFPPTDHSLGTGPPFVARLGVFPFAFSPSHPTTSTMWMFFESLPTPVVEKWIRNISARPLAAASRHELPWKHLATQASDSVSQLGVIKSVKWNRWDSLASVIFLSDKEFIIPDEKLIIVDSLVMFCPGYMCPVAVCCICSAVATWLISTRSSLFSFYGPGLCVFVHSRRSPRSFPGAAGRNNSLESQSEESAHYSDY